MVDPAKGKAYAPFGSVSVRTKVGKIRSLSSHPGPGAYEISLPLVRPIIQTIEKKNNNVIVRFGHVGTYSFQGNAPRFSPQLS